ncbi:hypothetical protein HPB50_019684 [Hyalomma asiaticum]|uniref:Uncharacterized protein n=1 Tax=Hyalomma asiaticum TaxID=266040 RepID=A0ACB7TNE6_HYAAI|nr:hypothetical protein HPB50_019684 [Hyalomma asiaticum]
MPGDDTPNFDDSTEDTAGVSAEVKSELAEFPGAIDGSTFDEFVSADNDVAIMGQLQDEDYIADVVPATSQSNSNKEIDDGSLPTSSEVTSALALVQHYCVNMEGCGLSCSDSLDNVEACVLSQAAKSLKQKKIQDYFVPKYQGGWFAAPRQQQQQPERGRDWNRAREANQQQQQADHPADEIQPQGQAGPEQLEEAMDQDGTGMQNPPPPDPEESPITTAWTFVATFFTSLIPEQPPPVNAN